MVVKKIAPFTITKKQREWVENEMKRTGESQASVMRKLIQDKLDKE